MRLKSSSVIGGVVGVGEPAWWLAWDVDFCRRVRALGEDVGEECAERFEVAKWVRFSELSECAFDVVQLAFNDGLEEFFTLTWNDNYGTPIRGLKGELTESFKDGMESGEEFSDAAHKRWMAISDKMSGKLDSAFYDQFKASVVPSEDGSMSEGVMEFGDIEVGSSGSFETGCGCLGVIALIIFLMILFS